MKKNETIFILFLCLAVSSQLKSQSYIGLRGGVNIPTVNFTDFTDFPISTRIRSDFFISPTFGVSYRYMQNEKIGLQFDLNYSTKGWGQSTLNFTNVFVTKIDYLELPFYFHWELFGKAKFKYFLDAGVYVAWALSSKQTVLNDIDLNENQLLYTVENDNRGDFGVYAGTGFVYYFSAFALQLDASFKSGFANILPVSHFTKVNPVVSTNQVPSVQFSILLPISISSQ